ncbi:hypothetical protein F5Y08DRAFT_310083, partial [Xylaria arbuscula]
MTDLIELRRLLQFLLLVYTSIPGQVSSYDTDCQAISTVSSPGTLALRVVPICHLFLHVSHVVLDQADVLGSWWLV